MIDGWYKNYMHDFIKALLHDDIKAMNYYMNKVALATFSFLILAIGRQETWSLRGSTMDLYSG